MTSSNNNNIVNLLIPTELMVLEDFVLYDTFYAGSRDFIEGFHAKENEIILAGKKPVFVRNPDDGNTYMVGHLENPWRYPNAYRFLGNDNLANMVPGVYYDRTLSTSQSQYSIIY